MQRPILSAVALFALCSLPVWAEDPVFSGPQPGEKLVPFKVLAAFGDQAGQDVDFVTAAGEKPLMLVFIHEPVTRPSAGLARGLAAYAATRKDDLAAGVVWLQADRSKAEQFLKQARNSLALAVPVGVSPDGAEGPGSYGLNRNVSITVVMGKAGKVTSNFALVQPALADGPKILADVVKLAGGEAPNLEAFENLATGGVRYRGQDQPKGERPDGEQRPNADGAIPRELLAPVIRLNATPEEVAKAAAAVEQFVGDNKARQAELGRIANTIVSSGKLENYGTPPAQAKLREWAKKYPGPQRGGGRKAE
jgi:hypothetical protein